MKTKIAILFMSFIMMTLFSCEEVEQPESKDLSTKIDTRGTVEVKLKLIDGPNYQVLETTKRIFNLNGTFLRNVVSYDTLPSLGIVKDTLATGRFKQYVDDDGDTQQEEIDTIITHPKDYQLFISVSKKQ